MIEHKWLKDMTQNDQSSNMINETVWSTKQYSTYQTTNQMT